MLQLQCKRCGYKWIPRKLDKPRECPDCKNRYWDKPRVRGRVRGR
jgi:predicted Zn-ribbon and HTH transcriptional regulator